MDEYPVVASGLGILDVTQDGCHLYVDIYGGTPAQAGYMRYSFASNAELQLEKRRMEIMQENQYSLCLLRGKKGGYLLGVNKSDLSAINQQLREENTGG